MVHALDIATFESTLVRFCSPTLAGIKPSALFTYSDVYACAPDADPRERQTVQKRREALLQLIEECSAKMSAARIEVRVLVWRACGALIYVYRPAALRAYLLDPLASMPLAREGYDPDDLESSIARLAVRIAQAGSSHAECALENVPRTASGQDVCSGSCSCTFPHEMGFFLGYPYEDVLGFIEHEGRDCLAVGPWKVYAHLDRALATFKRFRRCTQTYTHIYRHGCGIETLARA